MVEILQTLNDENLSCRLFMILKLFILELFHALLEPSTFKFERSRKNGRNSSNFER